MACSAGGGDLGFASQKKCQIRKLSSQEPLALGPLAKLHQIAKEQVHFRCSQRRLIQGRSSWLLLLECSRFDRRGLHGPRSTSSDWAVLRGLLTAPQRVCHTLKEMPELFGAGAF